MSFRPPRVVSVLSSAYVLVLLCSLSLYAASPQAPTSSSKSSKAHSSQTHPAEPVLDLGSVSAGVYRNPTLGFACKIPAGWVLRTEAMNLPDSETAADSTAADSTATDAGNTSRVLLAAFSRPPEARADDVNASILIAAESAAVYPGLKDAAQYFGPLTEVAKAQGFEVAAEPYEFVIGLKKLARSDFQKDVGKRVMRQSTLVMLKLGYAVSFTFIAGTEDELEALRQGLSFSPPAGSPK